MSTGTNPALRFNKGTELNQSFPKVVVVRDYGHGVVEVGLSSVPAPNAEQVDRRRHQPQAEFQAKGFEQQSSPNLERSMRRTKATIRRKCMAGGLDHLLTLTYRENMVDVDQAYRDLTRFLRLVRVSIPDYKYVCVLEYQQRGAIHFHLAVKGFQQVNMLRAKWLQVVGENNGNIDVQSPKHARANSPWHLAKLAGYMTKYITKTACTVFGRQRYRVAEGIEIPRKVATVLFPAGVDMLQEIFDSLGADITHRFEAEQGWAWACSW